MQIQNSETTSRVPRRVLIIDDEQRMANSLKALLSSYGYEAEAVYSGAEGIRRLAEQEFPVVVTDLRMNDGDGFSVMKSVGKQPNIAFIVITGHASTESAIRALQQQAFDYITKPFDFDILKASIEKAFAKVEADRFREDMLSMITHDIKIPLSSIIGYSSLVFDKQTGQLNPRAREFVQTINANGVKILSLIDNFLTSCKIESGKLTIYFRDVNINFIIEDLLCVLQVELERGRLVLETDLAMDLPMIKGDENLLFRAISNVLSNAVKFTPRDGHIKLTTRRLTPGESPLKTASVLIEVANTGPGIAPEELSTIFERYRRSRNQAGIEGSGIGSYVLKYIIEEHGGRVDVQSIPKSLTTFTIYLPIDRVSQPQEGQTK